MKQAAEFETVATARRDGTSILDALFAGGSTALFLVIMASVVGSVSLYFQ
jgi:hypothetical protein